jgi:AraC family transcriptional regulator, arabinose operon regulatory protein
MQKLVLGFSGQRLLVIPFYVMDEMGSDELCKDLYMHSIGHYPDTKNFYVDRPQGCQEYILIYCVEGEGWYVLDGKKYTVSENQVFILPANLPHHYGASKKNPWSIYWVHLKGKKAELLSPGFIKPVTVTSHKEYRIGLFNEIYETLINGFNKSNLLYACLTLGHFLGTFKCLSDQEESFSGNERGQGLVNLAIHYMNIHINSKVTLDDLARHTFYHYSPTYFNKLFVKTTGYSPIRYFLNLKIERACYYLSNTSYKVNQIAKILGFRDAYYFSRLFSKIKKVPPGQYRKSNSAVKN